VKKAKLSVLLGSIFILQVFTLGPALSAPMSSASYSIPSLTISSGGHTGLQSTSYKLQDIKGQAVIGSGSSASFGLGIGGVYGTLAPGGGVRGEGVPGGVVDTGRIRGTWIERTGTGVTLHWGFDSLGATDVKIYYRRGAYSATATDYGNDLTSAGALPGTTTSAPHNGILNDGNNYFYRVVPAIASRSDIMNLAHNSITVAKMDFNTTTGYNVFNLSLSQYPDDYSIQKVIGDQLTYTRTSGTSILPGDEILSYGTREVRFLSATYSAPGSWAGDQIKLYLLKDFVIRIREGNTSPRNVSIVGRLPNAPYSYRVFEGYNGFGLSLADKTIIDAGFVGDSIGSGVPFSGTITVLGDEIYRYVRPSFLSVIYSSLTWGPAPSLFNLEANKGYYYRRRAGKREFDWLFRP